MTEYDYDLFVIGAGSGGVRASRVASSLGARVAIAEERYFGGTCVNVGCVPKKLFSYAAHFHDDFEDSRGFGWSVPDPLFDWSLLRRNKDNEISRLNGIYKQILDSNGVEVFEGRARIAGANRVSIDNARTVSARHILIATGSWPWLPDIPGKDLALTSNDLFRLDSLPQSMIIVGGGYIAVEFASIFTRLGVQTTLVYRGDSLLRGFDEDIRQFITEEIGKSLTLLLNEDIVKIENNNNGLLASLKSGSTIEAGQVVMATGRTPLTDDLGLEHTSIELAENGAILVDKGFETAQKGIFAIGDVIDRVTLTPVALAEGQWLAHRLYGQQPQDSISSANQPSSSPFRAHREPPSYLNIPSAVFCHPNIATVGLSEQEARAQGMEIDVYQSRFRQLKHTLSGRDEPVFMKLIVNQSDDRVVGLHMVGPDAGELVQGFAVAINAGATKAQFDSTIGIHPTMAEEFVTLRTPS